MIHMAVIDTPITRLDLQLLRSQRRDTRLDAAHFHRTTQRRKN